jgi:hypothetical protein
LDIRCGNNKVLVCHGKKCKQQTLCINRSAVSAHLNHGCTLGACTAGNDNSKKKDCDDRNDDDDGDNDDDDDDDERSGENLELRLHQNPSAYSFDLNISSAKSQPVTITVTDNYGRIVYRKSGVAPNSTLHFGSEFRPGVYMLEAVQSNKRARLVVVKSAS